MSVTTTNRRLTRQQNSQMPALLEFYSPSAALLETREQGPARAVIWTILSMFVACIMAAWLIPIDKVVTGTGRLVATESTIVVQPLETSIVREIDVHEGDIVRKGQLLARLDPTFTNSDRISTSEQVDSYRAEVQRLQAEAAGTDFHPDPINQAALVQQVIFNQRRADRSFVRESYRQKIESLKATLAKAQGDIQSYSERAQVASTVESKRRELERLGWGSQLNRLQATDQRLEADRFLQNAQQTAKSAEGDLQSMQAQMDGDDKDWHAKVSQDLTDASRKLEDAKGSLAKASLRSHLVELRAEADATVLTVARISVGSVLQSGDQFLTLVPLNAPLEIEALVTGNDAGFVHDGNDVKIKFNTFPSIRYGGAEGKVMTVSPDSFTGAPDAGPSRGAASSQPAPTGQSFYKLRVALDRLNLHDTPSGFHLTPGMPVTADIMVGKRTVLSYIFSRALPVAMDGMREP